jgi:subtilisin family serine protease
MKFKWRLHTFFIIQLAISISNVDIIACDGDDDETKTNDDFSDYWLLKINGDLDEVKQLATEHKFKLLNKVGSLDGYYHVKLDNSNNNMRHRRSSVDHMQELKKSEVLISSHPSVEIFQREKVLKRSKRDFIEEPAEEMPTDRKRHRKFSHHRRRDAHPIDKRSSSNFDNLLDPYWDKMWYLNRNTVFHSDSPDMNVTGAWDQGFSGKGTSVTFLDDGLEWDHPDIKQNYVILINFI